MHIITIARLKEFWNKHPDSEKSLRRWNKQVKQARWESFNDLRTVFTTADAVRNLTVFDIGGNKYRLIALVDYKYKEVYIRAILTHAEYDKETWKNDPWFFK